MQATLIAEIGTNFYPHDPLEALRVAHKAGADIIKIQLFRADTLYATESLKERIRPFEFNPEWLRDLEDGISVWASVFDVDLAEQALPYLDGLKVASGDLVNKQIVEATARMASEAKIPLALSTGAAERFEVVQALKWVSGYPLEELILFQCVSTYPARPMDYNLSSLLPFKRDVDVLGLSDHTPSFITAMIARALGYEYFERHVRPDTEWPGISGLENPPDWGPFAFTPEQLAEYRMKIEWAEEIIGDGVKKPTEAERQERAWARRGADGLRPTEEVRGS